MGQGLAGLICGTAITSQFLASNFHVNTPMLQSFLNYLLLTVTYTTMLLCRTGDTRAEHLRLMLKFMTCIATLHGSKIKSLYAILHINTQNTWSVFTGIFRGRFFQTGCCIVINRMCKVIVMIEILFCVALCKRTRKVKRGGSLTKNLKFSL